MTSHDVFTEWSKDAFHGHRTEAPEESLIQLSTYKVLLRTLFSWFLVALFSLYARGKVRGGEPIPHFNCRLDDPLSIVNFDGVADLDDDGRSHCELKMLVVIVSSLILLLSAYSSLSKACVRCFSFQNPHVDIPIVNMEYRGFPSYLNGNSRCYQGTTCMLWSCWLNYELCMGVMRLHYNKGPQFRGFWWDYIHRFLVFFFVALPDIAVAVALIPVNVLLLLFTETIEDLLVNLVAVQLFSNLADVLLDHLFNPREYVGQHLILLRPELAGDVEHNVFKRALGANTNNLVGYPKEPQLSKTLEELNKYSQDIVI